MAKLAISKIRVRNRYRRSLGGIESLAASIKVLGLRGITARVPGNQRINRRMRLSLQRP
jgi:hypothetical protein